MLYILFSSIFIYLLFSCFQSYTFYFLFYLAVSLPVISLEWCQFLKIAILQISLKLLPN